eukprot:3031372-Rhodomonas_salina.2
MVFPTLTFPSDHAIVSTLLTRGTNRPRTLCCRLLRQVRYGPSLSCYAPCGCYACATASPSLRGVCGYQRTTPTSLPRMARHYSLANSH